MLKQQYCGLAAPGRLKWSRLFRQVEGSMRGGDDGAGVATTGLGCPVVGPGGRDGDGLDTLASVGFV